MIAFPVAHMSILLSNSLPQAAIHLKLKCESLLIPWGGRLGGFWEITWCFGGVEVDQSSLTEYKRGS